MPAMLAPENHEPLVNSIVLLAQDAFATPLPATLSELEERFGSFVDASEGVLSPLGPAVIIKIPKRNLDIMLSAKKIEFNHRGVEFDQERAHSIAEAVHIMNDYIVETNWQALGYNYNIVSTIPLGGLASVAIAERILDSDLGTRISYQVLGASATLFLEVDEFLLTLKLEPRGTSREGKSIWVQGNFETRSVDQLPSQGQLAERYEYFNNIFMEIIGNL